MAPPSPAGGEARFSPSMERHIYQGAKDLQTCQKSRKLGCVLSPWPLATRANSRNLAFSIFDMSVIQDLLYGRKGAEQGQGKKIKQ